MMVIFFVFLFGLKQYLSYRKTDGYQYICKKWLVMLSVHFSFLNFNAK